MKKLTAWILTVSMLLSTVILPAAAEDRLTVSLSDGQVEAGGTVTLDLSLSNNTELSSLTVRVFYKADVLSCTQVNAMQVADGSASVWQTYVMDCMTNFGSVPNSAVNPNDTANLPADRADAGWKMASLAYTPVVQQNYTGNGVIASLTFRALEDLEPCDSPVEVQVLKATGAGTNDVLEALGSGATLTVKGQLPTITTVAPAASAVTVAGGSAAAQTVQMSAASAKGTDITSGVTWTVSPAGQGVTVNGDGLVSVEAKAQAGTYTVTASAKSGLSQGEARTAAVTVTRSTAVPAQVTVSGTVDTILVPGTGKPGNTADFTAAVADQFGSAMAGQSITWAVLDSNGQPVAGVTVQNGTVTVSEAAAAAITDTTGKTLTVKAEVGGVSGTREITVKRAANVITGIGIYKNGSQAADANITIPLSGSKTEQYTVRVFNQYGQEMSASTAWSVVGTLPSGVTMENGTITVNSTAADGSFGLKVSAAGVSAQIQIAVSSLAVTWESVDITTVAQPVYGSTNDDIVNPISAGKMYYSADGSANFNQYLVGTFAVVDGTAIQAAGDRRITVRFTASDAAENGEFKGVTAEKTINVTIDKASLTVSGASVADKVYNGKSDDAAVSGVNFSGLVNGETLTAGTDYTVSGVYADKNAGDAVAVTVTVVLKDTAVTGNYELTGASCQTTGVVSKTTTTLALSAGDAVYTGANYDESSIVKTGNVEDAVTYTYYSDADCTQPATPKNVGTYYVKGVIAATTNASSAQAVASFKITAAPLTIKAKDHSITYGEAPANGGVTYEGLVNGETESVVSGLTYSYNYTQYGDVGSYTITPKDASAANYAITYESGTLTVEKKAVTLTWTGAGETTYNGEARQVTATVNGLVNGDAVSAVVFGGSEREIGSYTAAVTGLIGAQADNYQLPDSGLTADYSIAAAPDPIVPDPDPIVPDPDPIVPDPDPIVPDPDPIVPDPDPIVPDPGPIVPDPDPIVPDPDPAVPTPNPFVDVTKDSYYYDAVLWAVEKGITYGVSATQFGPEQDCTRGQMVTFLWRAAGMPEVANRANPFTDVAESDYYYEAVLWAVENGITYGVSETRFAPDESCTRSQMVTFLWRANGREAAKAKVDFVDVKAGEYYAEAVAWAVENSITFGVSATRFAPDQDCTRGQMAAFLYRCQQAK